MILLNNKMKQNHLHLQTFLQNQLDLNSINSQKYMIEYLQNIHIIQIILIIKTTFIQLYMLIYTYSMYKTANLYLQMKNYGNLLNMNLEINGLIRKIAKIL
jgi:hypothetical protein